MRTLQKHFSFIALCLLLILLPLYVDNSYFNIIEAKTGMFFLIFFVLFLPAVVVWTYRDKTNENIPLTLNTVDIGLIAFSAVSLVSCFLSGRVYDSFTGADGWYVGAGLFAALVLMYLFFSRNFVYDHNLWLPVYAVNIFIFITGLLQHAGCDIFGFTRNLEISQHFQYISTYGNANWYAGYLCILIPIAVVFFISSKSAASYSINLLFLIFALSGALICISDGVYLGIGLAAFFLVPYVFGDICRLRRMLLVGLIFSAEATLIGRLTIFNTLVSRASGISKSVFDEKVSMLLLAFFAVTFIVSCFIKRNNKKVLTVMCILCEAVIMAGVIFFVIDTINAFTDTWGSSRGFIWRVSFEYYSELSITQKIFGIGPDLLRDVYSEVAMKFQGLAVLSSHSEPIQILLTTGILGVVSWLTTIVGVIICFVKQRRRTFTDNIRLFAFFLALSAYLGQSLVNSATTVNLCLLYIILSFYRSASAEQTRTEGVL